ncbi:MAG TPA: 23S rRNA (adenine(2503)-C(2))-methyltransferase RlmN [Tepidisphaeraceae bacterium]|nr:23S rRNA (adenine(2503)-C(2))-methyltransferase RlmN [Tepidisphaeraceae bacterium]
MPSLVDHDLASLEMDLQAAGHKPVHALRVLRHFYANAGHVDLEQLTIGSGAREHLRHNIGPRRSTVTRHTLAADGTAKFLIGFASGGAAEAVLMLSHREGVAAGCVSSQIGCAMGCDFCASTRGGFERDLDAGEIVEQFLHLKEQAAHIGRRLRTLVFMGMGEPLLNFDNVVAAIRRIGDPNLGGLGWRQMTISTVGIVPAIDRLAELDLNVHLAVSLHAPDDATRSRLVPMNRRHTVADVMNAARRFETRTGRTPTIEYCMLAGVNDSDEQAMLLADLMEGFRAHVNLIPYNPIGVGLRGVAYSRPTPERMNAFIELLRSHRVVTHFRAPRGDDVNAACGQLRANS